MGDNKENQMENSVTNIKLLPCATSTAMKKKKNPVNAHDDLEDSLGLLNLSNTSSLSGFKVLGDNNDIGRNLETQRALAEQSLQRLSEIPSKFLRSKDVSDSISENLAGSTINESDLLNSLDNYSNPRSSIASLPVDKYEKSILGKALSELSFKISKPQYSLDDLMKDLNLSMATSDANSEMFRPAAEVKSELLANEMSWRKKNEIPYKEESFTSFAVPQEEKYSMGEFFKQKSSSFADLQGCVSPKRGQPVTLLPEESSMLQKTKMSSKSVPQDISVNSNSNKVLKLDNRIGKTFTQANKTDTIESKTSISQIKDLLANSHTPTKIINLLLTPPDLIDESEMNIQISKNSSYTSNYSENAAINQIVNATNKQTVPNKPSRTEIASINNSDEGGVSPKLGRSSSLSSLTDGKLPLESTTFELIWGCVKVDKSETKEFLIRNKSSKVLRIQIHITGPNFKIRKDIMSESDTLSAAKLVLHGYESRQILVTFSPTKNGAAFEELRFTSLDFPEQQSKKQSIKLFGYGGYINVDVVNIPKDLSSKYLINLGTINKNIIVQTFLVKNTGNLAAFCHMQYRSKHMTLFSNVMISPNFFSLMPNESKEITVSYEPSMNDHKSLQTLKGVVHELGSIKLLFGAEVNRARLRRLCNKATELQIKVDPQYKILIEKLQDEVIPNDVSKLRDALNSIDDIGQTFKSHEIVVILEQDPDQTIMPQMHDESDLFTTLCADSTTDCSTTKDICKLEPEVLILSPPVKTEDTLFLISENNKILHYEAQSNPSGLEISPKIGKLLPGETIILRVKYSKCLSQKQSYKVIIYVDNAVLEAQVKVFYISKK
ncbi:uncharacterized protein LOC109609198 [Aethina tumida]|uniref:uncharacterized protein LOC109609198 n=1 Tax=Aethina tumida TaxID=116153 RepID=UPI00096B00CB|nr:uncharacterized protein LOC109609198 [Aethina tumida]